MSHSTPSAPSSKDQNDDTVHVLNALRIAEHGSTASGEAKGEVSPASQVLVYHSSQHLNQQTEMSSLEVSADGMYATTISHFVENPRMAQVDLWNISLLSRSPSMQQQDARSGFIQFDIGEVSSTSLKVAISPTGSHLAVYKMPPDVGADGDFFAVRAYHLSSEGDKNITWNTTWNAARWMMDDLNSKFLGRDIDIDTVSVWNWKTGANVCYLEVPSQQQGLRRVLFSRSGSLTVVASSFNWISSFFTASGIRVSRIEIKDIRIDILQVMDHRRLLLIGEKVGEGPVFRIYDMSCLHIFIDLVMQSMDGVLDLRVLPHSTMQNGSLGRIILNSGSRISVVELRAVEPSQGGPSEGCLTDCNTTHTTGENGCCPSDILEIKQDGTCDWDDPKQRCSYKWSIENGATKFTLSRRMDQDAEWVELLSENTAGTEHRDLRYLDAKYDANDYIIKIMLLSCKSRFVVVRGHTTQLWELPLVPQEACKLLTVSVIRDLSKTYAAASVHDHARSLQLEVRGGKSVEYENVDISGTTAQQISKGQTVACIEAIPFMIRSFRECSSRYQQAVMMFVMQRINQRCIIAPLLHDPFDTLSSDKSSPDKPPVLSQSVMAQVVKHCDHRNSDIFLAAILNHDGPSVWAPYWSPEEPQNSMLVEFLLKHSKMEMSRQLIDYCLYKAKTSHPGYIDILTKTLQHFHGKFPEVSKYVADRSAFIPASNRRFMLSNAVTNGPQWQLQFWEDRKTNLHEFERPVFQLQSQLPMTVLPTAKDLFIRPPFIFPPQPPTKCANNLHLNSKTNMDFYMVPVSLVYSPAEKAPEVMDGPKVGSRFVAYLGMIWHLINFAYVPRIRGHFLSVDVYDNPGFAAIQDYKWERIARPIWIMQYSCIVAFGALVLEMSRQQIYQMGVVIGEQTNTDGTSELVVEYPSMTGAYITTIIIGFLLLYIECQQLRLTPARYFKTMDYVVLSSYILPAIGSIIALIDPNNGHGSRMFSFAILFTYNNIASDFLLLNLRIFENISRVFTILGSIIKNIALLLAVMIILVWTYAHGFGHIIHMEYKSRCPSFADPTIIVSETCKDPIPEFPNTIVEALVTTWFFPLGRFDAITKELSGAASTQLPVQMMAIIFTLLMTYLLVNVVIAFMGKAYDQGDIDAPMVWMQNRLNLIIVAENLTRFIPNYRLGRDHFPKYIIYTATKKEIKKHNRKMADWELDI
ncbi:hypothetical protein BGW38_002814 [Lunasporangiospora selenospora]|uniref:Ion transport domain-containing protein n=1 Tax=Lunasporangiospora selenospora TaxID=979761 RepID=A0A9P6FRI8_9FUNG|nr:hypothetical protein BGW38_002814 [Lunasporangiospora selenospora]